MAQWWTSYIVREAKKRGLDPQAVLAVARQEGLSGRVGDHGTSYGPFQLHRGGALPSGKNRQWAESPQGISFALNHIQSVAGGLKGNQAVQAIVSRFERPANPSGEIARAIASYRAGAPLPAFGGMPMSALPSANGMDGNSQVIRQQLGQSIMAGFAAIGHHQTPNFGEQALLTQQLKSPPLQSAPQMGQIQSLRNATSGGDWAKYVKLSRTADRPGVRTNADVLKFVGTLGQSIGHPLVIGTGTRHNRLTVNGRVSAHWSGNAADIPATGNSLTRLGQAALVRAGMSPEEARKQKGGLYNIGHFQIIFNTNEGGNHFNHLHVGIRG